MEALFLNMINAVSESRCWLGPIILICVLVMVVSQIINIVQDEIEDFRN